MQNLAGDGNVHLRAAAANYTCIARSLAWGPVSVSPIKTNCGTDCSNQLLVYFMSPSSIPGTSDRVICQGLGWGSGSAIGLYPINPNMEDDYTQNILEDLFPAIQCMVIGQTDNYPVTWSWKFYFNE